MTYVKQTWQDFNTGGTPISAERLTHIEDGIFEASTTATAASVGLASYAPSGHVHAASAVTFAPTGTVAGTNVQAAIGEVASDAAADLLAHTANAVDAHDASAISVADAGGYYTGTTVEAVLAELPITRYPGSYKPLARGAVCFTFDDGYPSWASVIQPAINPGQRCTFFVTTNNIGSGSGVSAATLTSLVAAGHELGAHSTNHTSYTSLTAAQRATDHDTVVGILEGYVGTGNVRSFAYPNGARSSTTDRECLHRYERIFNIGSPHWKPSPMDLPGQFVYGRMNWGNTDGQGHQKCLDLIRLAQREPIIVTIYAHDPSNTSGSFPSDPSAAQVAEAFDLCASLGVPMMTVSEALNGAPYGLTNGGFESGLSEWAVTNSGGYTVEVVTDTPATGLPGSKSLHILTTGVTTCFVEQIIPVVPGQPFNLSYQYKHISGAGHMHTVQEYNYDGTAGTATTSANQASGAGAWTAVNRDIAALGTSTIAVGIKFISTAANEFYIDHVHAGYQAWGKFG